MHMLKLSTLGCVTALMLGGCSPAPEPAAQPTPEVGVIEVQTQAHRLTSELPGRTKAWLTAEIRPQVSGIIKERLFTEGVQVKAGEVLYRIDPAPYQAVYDQRRAATSQAKSTLDSARLKAKRYTALTKIDAVSQQDNEDSQASLQSAEAAYQAAKASEQSARIDLTYTTLKAPIGGRVETSSVTPGALVTASQETALTKVQQLDPLYVDITQSSAEVLRLKRDLAEGRLQKAGNDEATIKLRLEDGTEYAHAGRLQFSGASVSQTTGSVTLRAVVPNPDRLLLPGMYVRAVLEEAVDAQAILVPQRAVTRSATGATYVLLVENGKLTQREVTIARQVENQWWISSGLKGGEQLVIEGGQKVRPGDTVNAQPFEQSAATAVASH